MFLKQEQRKNSLKTLSESKKRASDEYMSTAGQAYSSTKQAKSSPVDISPTITPASGTSDN